MRNSTVLQPFRFVWRERALAFVIIGTLALGIGITTAAFSVLDAVALRPLAYREAAALVVAWQQDRTDRSPFTVSPANFLDWQRQATSFDALAAIQEFGRVDFSLATAGGPESVKGVHFSPELFAVLGVAPALGRAFTSNDAQAGTDSVVLLSHALWASRFGADPAIVGRAIRLNARDVTVIGVMPAGFEVPLVSAQLYLPLAWTAAERQERRISNYLVLGRLKGSATRATAGSELDHIARALERQYPNDDKDVGATLTPLEDEVVGNVRPALLIVFAAAGCLLLLVCFNVATLLGARGLKRAREIAIRAALGASQRRLVAETVGEGAVLAACGAAGGIVCANWAVNGFVRLFNDTRYFSLPRRHEIAFDWRVVAFVAATCALVAVLSTVWPAARAMNLDVIGGLRGTIACRDHRWRTVIMTAELAAALTLVVAALLLVRSYRLLASERLGFTAPDVLTARVSLPVDRYSTPEQQAGFFRRVLDLTRVSPELSVAAIQFLPLNGVQSLWSVAVPGRPDEALPSAFHFVVTPDYFDAMRIPILAGRPFDIRDTAGRRRVAILSAAAARRYFPGQNPIGRVIRIEDRAHADWGIVGIAADVRNVRPDRPPRPEVYVPMEQSPVPAMTLVVRSADHGLRALTDLLRSHVATVDSEQALSDVKTMAQVVADASAQWRIVSILVSVFGATAFVLALTGLYGLASFNVTSRAREIAIRLALGESRLGIVRLVLRTLLPCTVAGSIAGLAVSAASSRALAGFLFGVGALDSMSFLFAGGIFTVLILGVGARFGWRAANLEPSRILAQE